MRQSDVVRFFMLGPLTTGASNALRCGGGGNGGAAASAVWYTGVTLGMRNLRRFGTGTLIVAVGIIAAAFLYAPWPQSPAERSGAPGNGVEILVSAAASLSDVLAEVASAFEAADPSIKVRLNVGSSGALARQIEHGAPVDLVILADATLLDRLVRSELIAPEDAYPLLRNELVLIRPESSTCLTRWDDLRLPCARRIALGNPAHVPAGAYGKSLLEQFHLWPDLTDRLVFGEDVRQVMTLVAAGEADAGVVYNTDASASTRVVVVDRAPAGSHPPIIYPLAILRDAPHPKEARRFSEYLRSSASGEIFRGYGFGWLSDGE